MDAFAKFTSEWASRPLSKLLVRHNATAFECKSWVEIQIVDSDGSIVQKACVLDDFDGNLRWLHATVQQLLSDICREDTRRVCSVSVSKLIEMFEDSFQAYLNWKGLELLRAERESLLLHRDGISECSFITEDGELDEDEALQVAAQEWMEWFGALLDDVGSAWHSVTVSKDAASATPSLLVIQIAKNDLESIL